MIVIQHHGYRLRTCLAAVEHVALLGVKRLNAGPRPLQIRILPRLGLGIQVHDVAFGSIRRDEGLELGVGVDLCLPAVA